LTLGPAGDRAPAVHRVGLPLLIGAGEIAERVAALADEIVRTIPGDFVVVTVDFVGFPVGDVFVAGYGTDFAEKYRHLSYIGIVEGPRRGRPGHGEE
jgi:hypoxanthine-guanine phosphoribosyltransferase